MVFPISLPLAIEDSWTDVLAKAVRGTGIDDKNLAASANIIPSQLKLILKGDRPSEDTLRRLAIAVGLHPKQFLDLAFQRYKPNPFDVTRWPGVIQIPSRYMDVIVNSYLIWNTNSSEAILFDTGTEFLPIQQALEKYQLKLSTICITHIHGDHIAILDELISNYHPKLYAPQGEPLANANLIGEGSNIQMSNLNIKALLTDGHSVGHLTYIITGVSAWPAPVAVVGDALFAGSMGGGVISYQRLRTNVQTKILTLPPATLICPGHGPTTTVEEEEEHNPFA